MSSAISLFWFRRDLRLHDNRGLFEALQAGRPVLPVFIFDPLILSRLAASDQRLPFIYSALEAMRAQLPDGVPLEICYAEPLAAFADLLQRYKVEAVFTNDDYEPYAKERDRAVADLLRRTGIGFHVFKDQVLYEKAEVVKDDGKPYLVYTPYYKRWYARLQAEGVPAYPSEEAFPYFYKGAQRSWPSFADMGFTAPVLPLEVPMPSAQLLKHYHHRRDLPALAGTTRLGVHLRFGTVSVRQLLAQALRHSETFVKELCWREFFMQILWHFPSVNRAFKPEYDRIEWRDDEAGFARWCAGATGYPLVDAGMRELAATGFMHNRVRMVTASFLCKHLLIDWRWGEAWFAEKLMDFELSANNGNWQWVAGCGCDAAPYFRIFNPELQAKRFDPDAVYIRRWVPEWGTDAYPPPMVDHKKATARCISAYKKALGRAGQGSLFP